MYENKEICSKCGGSCCKTFPGCYYPEDFGLPGDFSKLDAVLESDRVAIDWWEGDPREDKDEFERVYFIRPAIKHARGSLYDQSVGECVFLTKTGCELSGDERPTVCRNLEPKEEKPCITHGITCKNAVMAWIPYQNKLKGRD